MTLGENPYRAEFTRRTLQHAMQASAAKDKVTRELAALSREKRAETQRRDVAVVQAMQALIGHAHLAGSGLASIGLFPTTPNYKEAAWLIDVSLAARDAPVSIREEARKALAGSHVGKAAHVGVAVVGKGKSLVSAAKWSASPHGQAAAQTVGHASLHMSGLSEASDYVQKILLTYSPLGLSTMFGGKAASIVMHILGSWGNDATEHWIASTVMPFFTPLSLALHTLSVKERLDQMQSLAQRYEGHCSCHGAIEKIYLGWMSWVAGKTINPIPVVGFAANVVAAGAMSAAHRIHKKVNPSAHHTPFYVATDLWQAARRPMERGFNRCIPGNRNKSSGLAANLYSEGRCPLALLALATLFGDGDPAKGARKAAAAVVAEQYDAARTIKHLIGKRSGNVVESTMARLDWCA